MWFLTKILLRGTPAVPGGPSGSSADKWVNALVNLPYGIYLAELDDRYCIVSNINNPTSVAEMMVIATPFETAKNTLVNYLKLG